MEENGDEKFLVVSRAEYDNLNNKLDAIEALLKKLLPSLFISDESPYITPDKISTRVLKKISHSIGANSTSRKQDIVRTKHSFRYFLKKHTTLSYREIGNITANADHSTVIYSVRQFQNILDLYPEEMNLYIIFEAEMTERIKKLMEAEESTNVDKNNGEGVAQNGK